MVLKNSQLIKPKYLQLYNIENKLLIILKNQTKKRLDTHVPMYASTSSFAPFQFDHRHHRVSLPLLHNKKYIVHFLEKEVLKAAGYYWNKNQVSIVAAVLI